MPNARAHGGVEGGGWEWVAGRKLLLARPPASMVQPGLRKEVGWRARTWASAIEDGGAGAVEWEGGHDAAVDEAAAGGG